MEAYELHFNPKTKKELAFETFCFEPETSQEKKLGSLYLAGLVKGKDEAGGEIISELATLIKAQYYQTTNSEAETAFKEVLRQANDLLTEINSKEPSLISFFALSSKGSEINFSRFGDGIKAVFCQKGKISELGKNAKEKNPAFKNIISGKLEDSDSVMILSSDIFDFFLEKKLLEKMASEKEIKKVEKILNRFKKETRPLSGFCLLLKPGQAEYSKKISAEETKKANWKKVFSLLFSCWKKRPCLPGAGVLKLKAADLKKRMPTLKKSDIWHFKRRKDLFNVIFLILILLAGFFMSQAEKKKELDSALKEIKQAEQMVSQADLFLKQKKNQDANLILQQALDRVYLQIKKSQAAGQEAKTLKTKIEEKLYSINKFKANAPFETLFELSKDKTSLIPNNLLCQNEKFYLFSSMSGKLLVYDLKNKSGETFDSQGNLIFGRVFGKNQILFLNGQNQVSLFRGEGFQNLGALALPYPGTELQDFEIFKNNLYFLSYDLNGKALSKEIIKYGYAGDLKWEDPQIWLEKAPKDAISITADGLIWILSNDGSIRSYYSGQFQNETSLTIFPYLKNVSKILSPSNLSNLYLLDRSQKRIIILDKNGEVVKQLQNDEWTDLLDLAVSQDGNKIYLLNGNKILEADI